ncbi:hypothetical protein EHM76_05390, partial [bacterium]
SSIEDFCHRCDLHSINRKTMESLIKAGAFDSLGDRGTLFNNINDILSLAQRELRHKETGQTTMFDMFGDTASMPIPSLDMKHAPVSDKEMAAWEKEMMGIPFSRKLPDPRQYNPDATYCAEIDAEMDGTNITVIGEVAGITYLTTRKDSKQFIKAVIEDNSGSIEVAVWPRDYEDTRDLWYEGNLLQLDIKVRIKDEEIQLSVNSADFVELKPVQHNEASSSQTLISPAVPEEIPEEEAVPAAHRVIIKMKQTDNEDNDVTRLKKINDIIHDFTGEDEVILKLENGTHIDILSMNHTGYCKELYSRLTEIIDEENVKIETAG